MGTLKAQVDKAFSISKKLPPCPGPGAILFKPGAIVSTPGAQALFEHYEVNPLVFLDRHLHGNWGECDPDDARTNDRAVDDGGRIFSVYYVCGEKIWVITEADRSATTFLLPDEY